MLQFISLLPQLLIQFIYCWAHSSLNSIFTGISRNDRSNSRTRFWLSQINCMTGPKNSGPKNKYFHHFYFHDYKKILNFFIEHLEYSQKHWSYFLFFQRPSSVCSSCLDEVLHDDLTVVRFSNKTILPLPPSRELLKAPDENQIISLTSSIVSIRHIRTANKGQGFSANVKFFRPQNDLSPQIYRTANDINVKNVCRVC